MNEPIRILHVFAQMDRGGAETIIMNIYRKIDRSKIQFDFIVHTNKKCAYDDEIESLGGKIFRVPSYEGINHIKYVKKWTAFFKEHPEYKIIHGHIRSTASIYLKIAKKFGVITIAHSHSTSSGKGIPALVKNILQYPIRFIADYFFACSKSAGEWLFGSKTCKKGNFFVYKNAIDAKKFIFNKNIREKKRKEMNLEGKIVIGHVGRFHHPKNHEFLIDIFKEVYKKNKNVVLLLIGEGDLKVQIQQKVYSLGLEKNVLFVGVRSDIEDFYQVMDVFVFPSLYEGLGIVLIEAQASGLPCIVAETIPEEALITDNIIQLSLTKSSEFWAEIIFNQIKDYKRKNTYEDIVSQGYDIEENITWLQEFYLGLVR